MVEVGYSLSKAGNTQFRTTERFIVKLNIFFIAFYN